MATKLSLSEFLEFSTNETTFLPMLPTLDQLKLIRKGLRKKKIPDLSMLPNKFKYEGVGKFTKKLIDSDYLIEWQTDGCAMKNLPLTIYALILVKNWIDWNSDGWLPILQDWMQ